MMYGNMKTQVNTNEKMEYVQMKGGPSQINWP